jgi:hypothetical protein
MRWLDTNFDPVAGGDRQPTRRIGLLPDLLLCVCVLAGYVLGQAWHCVRYLMRSKP